jgi:hypothetical protein
MAMGGGPPLHGRPRGAGAAETTSWAVGGAPQMSPTPIWLVGIVARRPSRATGGGDAQPGFQPFLSIARVHQPGAAASCASQSKKSEASLAGCY